MSLPLATTRIRVWRIPSDPTRDPLDEQPAAEAVLEDVRAVISQSRRQENPSGSQEVVFFRLDCDPIDLKAADEIEDQTTGQRYNVIGPRLVNGIGAIGSYVRADLRQVTGVASLPRDVRLA